MNRLILLGNGFDLAHGLPTSYEDFILNYAKEEIENNFISQKVNSKNYFGLKLHHKKEELLNSYSPDITKGQFIRLIRKHLIYISATSLPEKLLIENAGNNWSEIESFFYKELIHEAQLKRVAKMDTHERLRNIDDVKRLNEEFDKVRLALEYYLTEYVEKKYHFEPQSDFTKILKGNKDTKATLLLNFNYTKTAEMYLSLIDKKDHPVPLVYIHGKLNEEMNPMIFGFGDEYDKMYKVLEEFNDNSVFHHIKSFGYFKSSSYRKMKSYVESEPYEIFIIGHSCGLSDRTLLKYLFEHKHCQSINIFYYKNQKNYIFTTQEISRHFTDKTEMRNKIIDFELCKPCPYTPLKKLK